MGKIQRADQIVLRVLRNIALGDNAGISQITGQLLGLRRLWGRQLPAAFLRQSSRTGLGIPKVCVLLQHLSWPPAASVSHFSKPGVMADFMLYVNPNNCSTLCKWDHALCFLLIYPCFSMYGISFPKAEQWFVVFIYHVWFMCSPTDGRLGCSTF